MDLEEPDLEVVKKAERLHRLAVGQQDERRAGMAAAYAALGSPDSVVLSICGEKYLPLLGTWLGSCDRRQIEVRGRTIVMALDEPTRRLCTNQGLQAALVDPESRFERREAEFFADEAFAQVMFHKNIVVCDALAIVPAVLFQDVDLIWLRDPMHDLETRAAVTDLRFMFDGDNSFHRPLNLNTGFFYAVANPATRAVFETIAGNSAFVLNCGSQQAPANRIIGHFVAHQAIRLQVLEESHYLNGHLFNLETGLHPTAGDWERDGVVVHYSWTGDREEKARKLELFGLA
jgi:hypothetical protein